MSKEKNLPTNFWSVKGSATSNLWTIFIRAFQAEPNPDGFYFKKSTIEKVVSELRIKNPKLWGQRSFDGMVQSIGSQLAWGLTNQTKIKPSQAGIYVLNQRIASQAKKIASNL